MRDGAGSEGLQGSEMWFLPHFVWGLEAVPDAKISF